MTLWCRAFIWMAIHFLWLGKNLSFVCSVSFTLKGLAFKKMIYLDAVSTLVSGQKTAEVSIISGTQLLAALLRLVFFT